MTTVSYFHDGLRCLSHCLSHVSLGHIAAQIHTLCISFNFFVYFTSFHTLGGLHAFRKSFGILYM